MEIIRVACRVDTDLDALGDLWMQRLHIPRHTLPESLAARERLESSQSSRLYSACSSVPLHDGVTIPVVRRHHFLQVRTRPVEGDLRCRHSCCTSVASGNRENVRPSIVYGIDRAE
jgi:hypothetical protein